MIISEKIKTAINKTTFYNIKETQEIAIRYLNNLESIPKWLEYKIVKYNKKYGSCHDRKYTLELIRDEPLIASIFSKNSLCQGIAERTQFEYLQDNGVSIEKPVDCIRLQNGELINSRFSIPGATKTFDGICKSDYITMKYTEIEGGSQTNQMNDAIEIARQALIYTKNHDDDKRFIFILDGNFYKNKLKFFKPFISKKIIITTSDEYINLYKNEHCKE